MFIVRVEAENTLLDNNLDRRMRDPVFKASLENKDTRKKTEVKNCGYNYYAYVTT